MRKAAGRSIFLFALTCIALLRWLPARAEDGYELWLRYHPLPSAQAATYQHALTQLVVAGDTPTLNVARDEVQRGVSGLLAQPLPLAKAIDRDGALLITTRNAANLPAELRDAAARLGHDGYLLRSTHINGHRVTAIVGDDDAGALYGSFRLLRLLQTEQALDSLDLSDAPKLQLRVLDHWDYLNGQVERGYAGASIWDWWKLPDYRDPRYTDYARANASIGINGSVINSVVDGAAILTPEYLRKAAALAEVFRPYGIRVYLSVRFSAPVEIGGLKTADPFDPQVQQWWRAKADEIYRLIPDFGGFLVKANSEGQPGPEDYHRTHADGANMLAAALAPHGGVVMWRTFVYGKNQSGDRAKQAYAEFKPLDGQFASNVLLQVKNGPIDFQPREPFHPLFGTMPKTPLMLEVEITKEYLGFATHLVYLGPLWQEVLRADTLSEGQGTTVAKVIDGSLDHHALNGMAGDANIGTDRNWSGSDFNQANWYAFGRLAWNPQQSAGDIAEDWIRSTFSNDPSFVQPVLAMMMGSREAAVNYMTPLGLVHLMGPGHHYGPAPWDASESEDDWRPVYYHRADHNGIGFERTRSGTDAVDQYAPALAAQFNAVAQTPENLLLYFHHLPWTYQLHDGHPLWYALVAHYSLGVQQVQQMQASWQQQRGKIDEQRYQQVSAFLAIQLKEAQWWRDACIAYFQSVSGLPLPPGFAAPAHPLSYYEALHFQDVPGFSSWQ